MGRTKEMIPEPTPEEIAAQLQQQLIEQEQYAKINVVNILYESFTKAEKERTEQKDFTAAPSYLSKCKRAIYWQKKGETPTNPPDNPSLFKMKMGDIIHDHLQDKLTAMGILESFEQFRQSTYIGLKFNYFYDGILNLGGNRAILEIKTVYANGFKSIEKEPKPEHILQTLSYMIFENLDRAIIIYVGRDNGYMLQYELRLQSEPSPIDFVLFVGGHKTDYYAQWLGKISELIELKTKYDNNELPDRDFSIVLKNSGGVITDEFQKDNQKYRSAWQCSYCAFKDKCWKSEYEQIKNHKFFINNKFH